MLHNESISDCISLVSSSWFSIICLCRSSFSRSGGLHLSSSGTEASFKVRVFLIMLDVETAQQIHWFHQKFERLYKGSIADTEQPVVQHRDQHFWTSKRIWTWKCWNCFAYSYNCRKYTVTVVVEYTAQAWECMTWYLIFLPK